MWKAERSVKRSALLPLLRRSWGANYTGKEFNRDLGRFLGSVTMAQGGTVTSHSFRSGIATSMALAGYTDSEIMSMGRWHSTAFLRYIKTSREKRAMIAQELAARMSKL